MNLFGLLFGRPVSTINPLELSDKLKNGKPILAIDVRQPDKYWSGHVAGAKLIPLEQLSRRMTDLPQNREIVCICASGNRSNSATRILAGAGFDAANMKGGMLSWRRAGLPVKKDNVA